MDLEALAARNRARTKAKNRRTPRQWLRLALLRLYAGAVPAPRTDLADMPDDARLLVIRPDHLGDVLFTTPALRALRRAQPRAHVTALVGPWAARVLQGNPAVDEILTCPFPGFTRQSKGSLWEPYELLYDYAKELRAQRFDAALILRSDHWWGALLAHRAGIPSRIGTGRPEVARFLTLPLPEIPRQHEVARNLALVAALQPSPPTPSPEASGEKAKGVRVTTPLSRSVGEGGRGVRAGLAFYLTDEDRTFANRALDSLDANWIAIHPGAGAPVKRWRPDAWAQVGSTLARETGARILLTGSADEARLCQEIAALMQPPPLVLAGQTDLGGLAALYARCQLVLGPDSGPLHLAVAGGTPTVHLYGPADPASFGPWGDPARHRVVTLGIDCSPCRHLDWPETELEEHPCVWAIPVERVLQEARRVLQLG